MLWSLFACCLKLCPDYVLAPHRRQATTCHNSGASTLAFPYTVCLCGGTSGSPVVGRFSSASLGYGRVQWIFRPPRPDLAGGPDARELRGRTSRGRAPHGTARRICPTDWSPAGTAGDLIFSCSYGFLAPPERRGSLPLSFYRSQMQTISRSVSCVGCVPEQSARIAVVRRSAGTTNLQNPQSSAQNSPRVGFVRPLHIQCTLFSGDTPDLWGPRSGPNTFWSFF